MALTTNLDNARVLVRDPRSEGRGPESVSAGSISAAIAALRSHGGQPGVHILGPVPADDDPVLRVEADAFVFEPPAGDFDRLAFDLKRALSYVRGRRPSAELSLAAEANAARALRARGLEAYVDRFLAPSQPLARIESLLVADGAARNEAMIWRLPDESATAKPLLERAAALQGWFPAGLAPERERALRCGSSPMATYLNPRTLDLVAIGRACEAGGIAAERIDVGSLTAYRVKGGAADRFAEGVDVSAGRTLTVEEIIARHQAAAARQTADVNTEIDRGSLTITFEAPGFVAPVTITSATTIYRDRARTDLRESSITVNGAPLPASGGIPRLPIIEPERVASLPLAITLTDVYRYRLVGRDLVHGRPVYIVAFSPRDRFAALFEGRAWIDVSTFGLARVSAAETGLRGAITASEQTDDYMRDPAGNWLLARSDIRQTYEGAGFRTPIHRLLILSMHEVNLTDFAARLDEAYRSNDVMLRDTPQGYRYLARASHREGAPPQTPSHETPSPGTPQTSPDAAGRVLAGRVDRIRTIAFGVLVDPNISQPLPFAGLAYSNFNLFNRGGQMSLFFGGTYGQLSVWIPSIGRSRWKIAGRAFGIATSYNDRAFVQGQEHYDLDIRQRPASASIWLVRPFAPRADARIEYDWDYNRYARGNTTSVSFVVPPNQDAHSLRVGIDAQRAGLQMSAWGSVSRRIGWQGWGLEPLAPRRSRYQRVGASALRTISLSPHLTTRVEGGVMTGWNLDRFSRYTFGTFDNILHGYPSALIRYDRGAVLRTAVAWAPGHFVRVDGFADTAAVHDPGFGAHVRSYTGFGAALEAPAPFGSLIAVEWGYGVRGVNANGGLGTNVYRIAGYKLF